MTASNWVPSQRQMNVQRQTLEWFPYGALHTLFHDKFSGQSSLEQQIDDETPEEVMQEVQQLFGEHFSNALTAQPIVRARFAGSEDKMIKPISYILQKLRGEERAMLQEYNEASNSLKLHLDFAGETHSCLKKHPSVWAPNHIGSPLVHACPQHLSPDPRFCHTGGVPPLRLVMCDLTGVPRLLLCAGIPVASMAGGWVFVQALD